MLGKSVCILFSGKAGTGKSTSANYLRTKNMYAFDCAVASFARGVKDVAYNGFGWDGKKDEKGRQLLIGIGNTARAYDPDIWAKKTFDEIIPSGEAYPFDFVFVDDTRYFNEIEYVRENKLYSVYVVRVEATNRESLKGLPAYNDISETEMPTAPNSIYNYVVDNTGTMEDLYKQLDVIVGDILSKETKWGE